MIKVQLNKHPITRTLLVQIFIFVTICPPLILRIFDTFIYMHVHICLLCQISCIELVTFIFCCITSKSKTIVTVSFTEIHFLYLFKIEGSVGYFLHHPGSITQYPLRRSFCQFVFFYCYYFYICVYCCCFSVEIVKDC